MASEKTNGEVYNLGGTPISLIDFVKKAVGVYRRGSYELMPFPKDRKKIEIGDYIADCSKIRNTVGWEPKVTLEQGLKRTFEYYEKYKEHYWENGDSI